MPGRDIVVVGASAGGVEALSDLISLLPAELRAAVLIVLHVGRRNRSLLPQILQRTSRLPVRHAVDNQPLVPGCVYVARPDHHLLLSNGKMQLSRGPARNGMRPAIDPLFLSAADRYGPRVLGIVLSGGGDDGTAGLRGIKGAGGLTVAQEPGEALYPSMPLSAIEFAGVNHVLRLAEIAALVIDEADTVDRALWPALRALEKRGALCRKLAEQSASRGLAATADRFRRRSAVIEGHVAVLHDVISRRSSSLDVPDYAGEESGEPAEGTPSISR